MAARDLEIVNLELGSPLAVAGRTVLGRNFPLGEGWYSLKMRFNISLVIGTGAGAINEGELLFIKNVLMRTSAGEVICNLPGRALYRIAQMKSQTLPNKNAIVAATGVYSVDIPIFFTDDALMRPEDSILDTFRYSGISVDVIVGTVSDLLTAPGTATVTCTADIEVTRTKGNLPPEALPIFYVNYETAPVVDAFSSTFIDLDRADDLGIKRLYIYECANGQAGVPFSGTPADDVKDRESLSDNSGFIIQERPHAMVQNANKMDYSLENFPAGFTVFDFVADGSINTALYTGDKSRLTFRWNNKAGVAVNDIVSIAVEGLRGFKA